MGTRRATHRSRAGLARARAGPVRSHNPAREMPSPTGMSSSGHRRPSIAAASSVDREPGPDSEQPEGRDVDAAFGQPGQREEAQERGGDARKG